MKLYNIYSIISNKTVRTHENFSKTFKKRNKYVLGQLVKTNRGYFIDGFNVDLASASLWKEMNSNSKIAKTYFENWKEVSNN